ncbi:MAG: PadR family transcriptional regulator [Chloroflexota bacterium]
MDDMQLVILSIVAESPRYGHEVQQVIERRQLRQWLTVGHASVFYVLNLLEKENLLRSELPYEDLRSARKRYIITTSGQAVLKTTLADTITRARASVGAFDVAMLTAFSVAPAMLQEALHERQVNLKRQISQTRQAMEKNPPPDDQLDMRFALYERSLALLEQDVAWLEAFVKQWNTYHRQTSRKTQVTSAVRPQPQAPDDVTDSVVPPERLQKFRRPPQDE